MQPPTAKMARTGDNAGRPVDLDNPILKPYRIGIESNRGSLKRNSDTLFCYNYCMLPPNSFLGVILAGGKGTRLGGCNKSTLKFRGQRLVDRAHEILQELCDQVVITGPDTDQFTEIELTVLKDADGFPGPLGGLIQGLREAASKNLSGSIILGVDHIGVTTQTLAKLLQVAQENDGASVLVDENGIIPTVGVLPVTALDAIEESAKHGSSLKSAYTATRAVEVPADPGETQDIDTQEDLDVIARSEATRQSP